MDAGLFDAGSVTRRVTRERALLLGGQRALLMQIAHPLVAAGVVDHSAFPADPVRRLVRTLDATLTIAFAPAAVARRAAARVNAVHASVHGTLREAAGRFGAGTPYDARDPSLALWVHATLVDSALVAYERFVAALTRAERETFWQESKVAARLLGVASDVLPPSLGDFEEYVGGMLASDAIAVAPFQRALGAEVLRPGVWRVPRRAFAPVEQLTLWLLPPRVAASFGYAAPRSRLPAAAAAALRRTIPALPPRVRFVPHARRVAWPDDAGSR